MRFLNPRYCTIKDLKWFNIHLNMKLALIVYITKGTFKPAHAQCLIMDGFTKMKLYFKVDKEFLRVRLITLMTIITETWVI